MDKRTTSSSLRKTNLYLSILNSIKKGKTLRDICQEQKLSISSLSYYLAFLKKQKCIKKEGYGVWKFIKELQVQAIGNPNLFKSKNQIRGHAFVFTLKIPKIDNWSKRTSFLRQRNIPFKDFNHYQSFLFKGNKTWLSKTSIVVYFKKGKDYYADTALDTQKEAIHDFEQIIKSLESFLGVPLKINGNHYFKVSRHHFARVRDDLAKKCNDNKIKIKIKLENGWFVIDYSEAVDEAETEGKSAIKYMNTYHEFVESLEKKPFTAYDFEELKENTDSLAKNTKIYVENIQLHLETLKEIKEAIKKLEKKL